MDGDILVTFDVRTPPEDLARANIAINEARALPEAVFPETVIIVGSGPSASDGALWERLRRRDTDESPSTVVVALNGALGLFLKRGLRPDYWCACDPQELVADFLPDDPSYGIVYLVATKCHPAVFERLDGLDVRKWRIDDYSTPEDGLCVPCACSITLVTQGLFRLMGYTTFEMYGWDCCYLDGKHHASNQPEPLAEQRIMVEGQTNEGASLGKYDTTGCWMAESTDAEIQARNFRAMGLRMIVHGPGLVGAILRDRGLCE